MSAETKATVTARHRGLGLSDQDVQDMYYYIVLARALDDRMWVLQRAGKAMFVISGAGHEGCQVAAMWPLDKRRDWLVPFYRSVAACLVKGMSPADLLLGLFARATDPSSGGRQMPGHYGHPRWKILSTSSPVGTQYPHAVGIAYAAKLRKTGEVTMVSVGEGGTSEGDWHEALNSTSSRSPSRCASRWRWRAWPCVLRGTGCRESAQTAVMCWSVIASPARLMIVPGAGRGQRSSSIACPGWGPTVVTINRNAIGPKKSWSRCVVGIPSKPSARTWRAWVSLARPN